MRSIASLHVERAEVTFGAPNGVRGMPYHPSTLGIERRSPADPISPTLRLWGTVRYSSCS